MVATINFDVSKGNNKSHIENKPCNTIVHNQDEFLNNSDFLLEDIKREYQEFSLNKLKDEKIERLSNKERGFYLDEQYVKNKINQNKSLTEINQVARTIENAQLNKGYPTDSLSDLFNEVKQSIVAGKNDYLDVLKDNFSRYMDFVKELREILSELSQATKAGSKDGYISVNVNSLFNHLYRFMNKSKKTFYFEMRFYKDNDGRLYRMINKEKVYYKNEAEIDNSISGVRKLLSQIKGVSLVKESKIPYVSNIYFLFEMSIDVSGVKKLIDYFRSNKWNKKDILQTEFELLKKTLDSVEKGVNANLDELSKKYSSANSNYDNFVKVVSSTMNTLLEMAKGFLRF